VVISFAGAQRELANQMADLVKAAGFQVFYDDYYQSHLWGEDLAVLFDEIYRKRARYCVILKSQEYLDRIWTVLERRSAVARSLQEKRKAYLLPVEIDDVELQGVPPTVGHISLQRYPIDQIAEMLITKLQGAESAQQAVDIPPNGETNISPVETVTATMERYLIDPYQNRILINRRAENEVDNLLPWLVDLFLYLLKAARTATKGRSSAFRDVGY
jgi:hypothetical protein